MPLLNLRLTSEGNISAQDIQMDQQSSPYGAANREDFYFGGLHSDKSHLKVLTQAIANRQMLAKGSRPTRSAAVSKTLQQLKAQ